jgi:hypothetical protein
MNTTFSDLQPFAARVEKLKWQNCWMSVKPILVLCLIAATSVRLAAQNLTEMPHPREPQHESGRAPATESSESIDVCGVTLRLGMTQDDVLGRVREYCELQESKPPSDRPAYMVWTKGHRSLDGLVQFFRGRLDFVYNSWFDQNASTKTAFANGLYGAVVSLEAESAGSPCKVTTANTQHPTTEIKTVFVTCEGRRKYLSIEVISVKGSEEYLSIEETLQATPQEKAAFASAPEPADSTRRTNQVAPSLDEVQAVVPAERHNGTKLAVDAAEDERREASELANPSSLVTIRAGESLPDEERSKIETHNRALCDQTITVAGLTPNGLALYVPPEGQKFMAKNSQDYPRMCLLEDATNVFPGVPRYLLVYAYSETAFSGFQPITRINTTTTPVSGSGTVMNGYGGMWNFTYSGTVATTVMDTIEAPYVIRSRSLYLNAYDENGALVSRHSFTVSSQIGGNGASAIGYNGAQLIALLWNNPSHLIKSVLKDVQRDSKKYGKN